MAFALFLIVALLSTVHSDARDSQFFNKVPSATNDAVVPNNKESLNAQQDPTFIPDKENGYGLYGHESGLNPPATTASATPLNDEFKQPAHKYLPKNYNPVAYVTEPEDGNDSENFSDEKSFSSKKIDDDNFGAQNFYDDRWEKDEPESRINHNTKTYNGNNANYYNGASSFNSKPQGVRETRYGGVGASRNGGVDDFQPQGVSDTRYRGNGGVDDFEQSETRYRGSAARNGGGVSGFQPQGMSDTRFMANGKYFYDVNADKYNNNHPYERLRGVRMSNEYNRNYYGNAAYENNNRGNSIGGYQNKNQNQEEFLDEESLP